ncbi:MAG: hypothetical protein KC777_14620 [Cyanobacteria bacterium HKST-UBA02]|nr:hypothetical protein [Cyanobacteria bacterium HKST-UBA02]
MSAESEAFLEDRFLAELFGLEELRIGRHRQRDTLKAPNMLWVQYYWVVEVIPSFHPRSVLAGIKAVEDGKQFENASLDGWPKIAYLTEDSNHVLSIGDDDVAASLHTFDILPVMGMLALDGICYKLGFSSLDVTGEMRILNPSQPSQIKLQSMLLRSANMVAEASQDIRLREAIKIWCEYAPGIVG